MALSGPLKTVLPTPQSAKNVFQVTLQGNPPGLTSFSTTYLKRWGTAAIFFITAAPWNLHTCASRPPLLGAPFPKTEELSSPFLVLIQSKDEGLDVGIETLCSGPRSLVWASLLCSWPTALLWVPMIKKLPDKPRQGPQRRSFPVKHPSFASL